MIGIAIDSAMRGMRAAAKRSEIASRNISGASEESYSRKSAVFASGPLGLRFTGIVRADDIQLSKSALRERASLAGLSLESTARTALIDVLGEPRIGNDLGSAITRLQQAFSRLGDQPEDFVVQNDVLGRAGDLTRLLNTASDSVQTERLRADQTIAQDVEAINDQLYAIEALNGRIAAQPTKADRTELLDERDRAVAAVMEKLPVRTIPRANDQITVMTETGITLVDTAVYEVEFTGASALDANTSLAAGQLSGLIVGDVDITPGIVPPRGQAPSSGTLATAFRLRDVQMPEAQTHLDALASQLAATFNAADLTISAATQGGLFLDDTGAHDPTDAASTIGLAGRLAVNALADPDRGGDLWRLRTGLYAGDPGEPGEAQQVRRFLDVFETEQAFSADVGLGTRHTLVGFANTLTAYQGNRKTVIDSDIEYQTSLVTALDARLLDQEGVDVDKELQDVLMFERSYAASANVLTAAQRMLDALLAAT